MSVQIYYVEYRIIQKIYISASCYMYIHLMFILLIIIDKFVIDICHMLAKSICQKAKRSNTPNNAKL